MKYSQWRSMKDTVKSSMHWATPKTSGRMIDLLEKNEPISLNPSPVEDDDDIKGEMGKRKLNLITVHTFLVTAGTIFFTNFCSGY